jgi:hypothetical protein
VTTRLQVYNNALMLCGERLLASLTEDREPRRLLDQVWDSDGVRYCLEQGQWQFAMRTQQIYSNPSEDPPFGYRLAFDKPSDWISTSAVCSDEYFTQPLIRYADELELWYADIDPIYVKFVSSDVNYGGDPSLWPRSFADYVDAYFASRIVTKFGTAERVTFIMGPPGKLDGGELGRRLKVAKNRAAMTQPTQFPPEGTWVTARRGGSGGDRGNRGSLIG